MESSDQLQTERIRLDAESDWLKFEIHGHQFEVEVFEANDLLAENDRKHLSDPDSCLDCGHEWVRTGDERKVRTFACPKCQSDNVLPNQTFLDGVAEMIRDRWGAPKCSRREAGEFYNACVDAAAKKKHQSETPPPSPSASEESTPEDGPSPQDALG